MSESNHQRFVSATDWTGRSFRLTVVVATLFGTLVRIITVLRAGSFPVNDGGMFYTMTRDLQANGFRLPDVTSYNGLGLPFAYSPLSFYVCGSLSSFTATSLLTWFRIVPIVATAATILAFASLARAMLPTRRGAGAAAFIFAVLPSSFTWSIMGGGVSRSLGLLFALLAIHQAQRLFAQGKRSAVLPGGLFVALALVSHLESGAFAACVFPTFALVHDRSWGGIGRTVVTGLVSLVAISPWWIAVIDANGISPFLNAGQTGGHDPLALAEIPALTFTLEPWIPLFAIFSVVGGVHCWRTGRRFLSIWPVVILLLDSRAGPTLLAAPTAMLASVGLVDVVLPIIGERSSRATASLVSRERASAALCGVAGMIGCLAIPYSPVSPVRSLSRDAIDAMAWSRATTHPEATFLVVSGAQTWSRDGLAEWFPAIAERKSLATAQGFEWRGAAAFAAQTHLADDVQGCSVSGLACLELRLAAADLHPGLVVVARSPYAHQKQRDSRLLLDMEHAVSWRQVFANSAVVVFEPVAVDH